MEDTNTVGSKKEAFSTAEKFAKFLTDNRNNTLRTTFSTLTLLGAEIFILNNKTPDPQCKGLIIPSSSPVKFETISLSQIGIIIPSSERTGGNIYRFTIDELCGVTEKAAQEGCIINLNNFILFETEYKYFAPISLLFNEYGKYKPAKITFDGNHWFNLLYEDLKTNGGLELIDQWQKTLVEKDTEVRAQHYAQAATLRDQGNNILLNLQEMLDKHFKIAVS